MSNRHTNRIEYNRIEHLTNAVLAIRGEVIAIEAQALERAHVVDALAIPTHLAGLRTTLINICTGRERERGDVRRWIDKGGGRMSE